MCRLFAHVVVVSLVGLFGCVSDDTADEAGDGVTTTDGASTTGATAGEEDSDTGEPEPEPIPPGPCIAIDDAPTMTCDDACAPNACIGGCWGVGQIGTTTAYYSSLADCEADVPLILQVNGCSDPFADVQTFFAATHVRCCCEP
jgi:hypothetical protein